MSRCSRGRSEMTCGCVVLKEEEEEEKPKPSSWKEAGYRLEKIFPVYAMGRFVRNVSTSVEAVSNLDVSSEDPIWDAMRAEAKSEAEKEPILSSFLYASILSHDCLERALGFVLANRLQNPTLLATQLKDIFDNVIMHDRGIQHAIRLDIQAFKDRDPSCMSYSWALLYLKGYHSLQSYRIAHSLWNQGRKILALALQSRISEVFAVDIHPGTLPLPFSVCVCVCVLGDVDILGKRTPSVYESSYNILKRLIFLEDG
eukprot:TRINITY_DN6996_c0_g1_i3.p1 TRINITY_DN6996_c0_g1~~TRINITY_DN6996_c0_g1_i3.p1  ORF type:complete len:257 (-),score=29.21 TRINITY_DN6996_c0_g1_i3:1943-2713(-)